MSEIPMMIASAIIGGIAWWIFTLLIIPVIGGWLNKAPKISGNWNYYDKKDGDVVGTAEIKQLGNRISVKAKRTKSRDGAPVNREFIYHGSVRGRDVILSFDQKEAGGFVCGAIVLHLDATINEMVGITAYFNDTSGEVVTHNIIYKK